MLNYLNDLFGRIDINAIKIPQPGITDIIDILLTAFIIYTIIVWFLNSRAWTLLKGILVLLVISIASYIFHFYTISWIVSNMYSTGILALFILFQPEIRRALEELGSKNLLNVAPTAKKDENVLTEKSVSEIINAVLNLSKNKVGALIVVENKESLDEFIATGLVLDAEITSQLIMNIFVDKTPLHDGAIIIKNNRIASAMSVLPLTPVDIGLEYGMRHRAAVGASEAADAVILVVSEETGKISSAFKGKMSKDLNESKLKDILKMKK